MQCLPLTLFLIFEKNAEKFGDMAEKRYLCIRF